MTHIFFFEVSIGIPTTAVESAAAKSTKSYTFSVHMPHPGYELHPYHQFLVVSMNAQIEEYNHGLQPVASKTNMKGEQ